MEKKSHTHTHIYTVYNIYLKNILKIHVYKEYVFEEI